MNDRILTGFIMPADERVAPGVYRESFRNLLKRADINFIGIIRTEYLDPYDNTVMVVDDDGYQRGLRPNRRAQFLSGYPLDHTIVGDVLFLGETMGHDGADFMNITTRALRDYFNNREVQGGFEAWLFSAPVQTYSLRIGYDPNRGPDKLAPFGAPTPTDTILPDKD